VPLAARTAPGRDSRPHLARPEVAQRDLLVGLRLCWRRCDRRGPSLQGRRKRRGARNVWSQGKPAPALTSEP